MPRMRARLPVQVPSGVNHEPHAPVGSRCCCSPLGACAQSAALLSRGGAATWSATRALPPGLTKAAALETHGCCNCVYFQCWPLWRPGPCERLIFADRGFGENRAEFESRCADLLMLPCRIFVRGLSSVKVRSVLALPRRDVPDATAEHGTQRPEPGNLEA